MTLNLPAIISGGSVKSGTYWTFHEPTWIITSWICVF